jgi:hypothetical protein
VANKDEVPTTDPSPDEERRLLADGLRAESAPPRPPRQRARRLRKVSEHSEKVWVDPRCGGSYVQWQMRPPS